MKGKMEAKIRFILIFSLCFTLVLGTEVKRCKGGETQKFDVTISACEKPTCILRRKSLVEFTIKFTPEFEIGDLTTSVSADISGVSLPFFGVDGTSACGKIFNVDGKTLAQFPLKAGDTYIYKNQIPILKIYPKVQLVVHWALKHDGKDVICFEMPAIIN